MAKKNQSGAGESEVAAALGVTAQALRRADPTRVVKHDDGTYDLKATVETWERSRRKPPGPGRGYAGIRMDAHAPEAGGGAEKKRERIDWRDKKERESFLKLRLERQQLQGKLVPVAEVEAEWADVTALVRGRLEPIGRELAPALAAETDVRKCAEMVDGAIREALEALAGAGEEEV